MFFNNRSVSVAVPVGVVTFTMQSQSVGVETTPTGHNVCTHLCNTNIRFGVLEDDKRQGEVLLGQANQVLCKQRSGCTFFLSLTAVQKRHRPLEGIFHEALRAGL